MRITTSHRTESPLLDIQMISHGTLASLNLEKSRRFYEEVLGFEVMQVSPVSLAVRCRGSMHVYAVVETGQPSTMDIIDHNGIDVHGREAVLEAHKILTAVKDEYGLRRIMRPVDQHGNFSFYFSDCDGNWWELMDAVPGGYSPIFDDTGRDLTGRTDIDLDEMGHVRDDEYAASITEKAPEGAKD
jgi:catechol 2,3-dioxygenase-like lactoylglutathione lyase family enzyme